MRVLNFEYTFKLYKRGFIHLLDKTPLADVALLSVPLHCSLTACCWDRRSQSADRKRRIWAAASHWSTAGGLTNHTALNIFSAESSEPNLNLWCNGWCRNYARLVGSSFFQINQDWKSNTNNINCDHGWMCRSFLVQRLFYIRLS